MKILCTGDWHIRQTRPKNRKDDYFAALEKKLTFIAKVFKKEECAFLLQPGDLFDSFKIDDKTKAETISMLRCIFLPGNILTVLGQHDMRYHGSDRDNTPTAIIEAAEIVSVLKKEGMSVSPIFYRSKFVKERDYTKGIKEWGDSVCFYGSSWGDSIPEIKNEKLINVLVIHAMVTDDPTWQKDGAFYTPKNLLYQTKFDLVVCGDNHKSFAFSKGKEKKRYLVNCGSLMRSSIDQIDHVPCVYVFDTEKRTLKKHSIPISPAKEVLDIEQIEEENRKNEELEVFIQSLSDNKIIEEGQFDFERNVLSELSKIKDEKVMEIMKEVMSDD